MNFSNDFLLWKDPVNTGSVFAALNMVTFIVLFCSPLLTFSYMGLVLMGIGFILSYTSPGLGQKVPDEIITDAQTQGLATLVGTLVNGLFKEAKCLFFWTDMATTGRAAAGMYLLKLISPFFSLTTILILVLEGFFLVPLAWQKADLGPKVLPHMTQLKTKAEAAWLAIPRASHVKKE
jgi:uncharacterized protein YjeT (DUF2065 family)